MENTISQPLDLPADQNTDITQPFNIINHCHLVARILYWSSILLLLCGMWLMINPFNHRPGQLPHIYITFILFETYIWLLLRLARWQFKEHLFNDAARSGIFAIVLTGFIFIILDELLLARPAQAYVMITLAVILAAAKLRIGLRWLDIHWPKPVFAFLVLWILLLAGPSILMGCLTGRYTAQNVSSYLICWTIVLAITAHIPLIAQQQRNGFSNTQIPFNQWHIPWLLIGIFAAMTCIHLYILMWEYSVNWVLWYFSPIALSSACMLFILYHVAGHRSAPVWIFLTLTVLFVFVAANDPTPGSLPLAWQIGWQRYLIHPVVPNVCLWIVIFLTGGRLTGYKWMTTIAVAPVTAFLGWLAIARLSQWRYGRAILLFAGSFALLAGGTLMQSITQKRKKHILQTTPPVPLPIDLCETPTNNE